MYKLLLCRGSPRYNIPEVEKYNSKMPCDNLLSAFEWEFKSYQKMRDYFLAGDWDYMVLATDDIVVKPEHIKSLQKDLDGKDYDVLSGMINVDEHDWGYVDGNVNICRSLALKNKKLRAYEWTTYEELPKENIFTVKFAGFGLTAIHRRIVERYEFAGDGIFKGKGMQFGASLDFVFCWWCHENQIDIYCDKRIFMQHLRTSGSSQCGYTSPKMYFIPKGKKKERIIMGRMK